MAELYIGLMSGTSMDGVDGLLLDVQAPRQEAVRAFASRSFSSELRQRFMVLNSPGPNELHEAALAGNALAQLYAQVVQDLLQQAGIKPQAVRAIGAHGQTVRHQPQQHDGYGYTLQINQAALLAELTGITVVADFRSRDVAAGGQGAPLAPFFHQAWFADAEHAAALAVLNIGGISNLSLLRTGQPMLGFDCGPGNVLMDVWAQQHLGQPYDADGAWAASGQVQEELLQRLLAEPYFALSAPKSTGRDLFHLPWLQGQLQAHAQAQLPQHSLQPADVQATLLELTARCVADDLCRHSPALPAQLVVCGGGAYNRTLMRRLQCLLPSLGVCSSADFGLAPNQVEAAAFAWLAGMAVRGQSLDLSPVTGAKGARILGAIYPA